MDGGVDWRALRAELAARAPDRLDGTELDLLADACFWTDDVASSIEHRRAAYRAHLAAGDEAAAGFAAWRLFYDHFLVGEIAIANGWRARGRRHTLEPDSRLAAWMELADAELAPTPDAARLHADRSLALATGDDDADLLAMALTASGRAAIACGDRTEGVGRLDEAMVAVINEELTPLFTGWVFCNVVGTCHAIADLQRAAEWSDAALRWCATLRDGHLYPGLCRVYSAEVAALRGDWEHAAAEIERACADLERFDERYAAEAHHLRGELARRQGDPHQAAMAFDRAAQLGGEPLPGRALLDADQGRATAALAALRSSNASVRPAPLPRVVQLRAMIDIARHLDDEMTASEASAETIAIAQREQSPLLDAFASAAAALTRSTAPSETESQFREAIAAFVSVGVPFEVARLRHALADHLESVGDTASAQHERRMAAEAMQRLGIRDDDRRTDRSPLSAREVEVLSLVADGLTNGAIADRLHLSPHTVNRHVSNIMTKLEVHTRAAASARAVAEGLL